MKRLNVVDFYEVGQALSGVSTILAKPHKMPIVEAWWPLQSAADALDQFAAQEAFQLARQEARALSAAIRSVIRDHMTTKNQDGQYVFKDASVELESWVFYGVRSALDSFVHVFKAECRDNDTYFIEQKAIYDTTSLVSRASDKIHSSMRPYITKAAALEIDEAGRCFAVDS